VKTTSIPVRLRILSLCAPTGVNKFSGAVAEETIAVIHRTRFVLVSFIYLISLSMDNITRINQYSIHSGAYLEPPELSKPILTPSYKLRPSLINLVQKHLFLGEGDENPYTHL
jgi:hypothetical protein